MNTNCLAGIKCPECGNEDRFTVAVTGFAKLTDDGLDSVEDADWDDDATTWCTQCDATGPWTKFIDGKAAARTILAEYKERLAEYEALVSDEAREKYQIAAADNVRDLIWRMAEALERLIDAPTEGGNNA